MNLLPQGNEYIFHSSGISIVFKFIKTIHFKININSPDFTASPICSSDVVTDFPFSRETLADDAGKQSVQHANTT